MHHQATLPTTNRSQTAGCRMMSVVEKGGALNGENERMRSHAFELTHSPALRMVYTLREQLTTNFDTARSKKDGLRNVVRLFQRLTLDLGRYRRFSPWSASRYRDVHGNS